MKNVTEFRFFTTFVSLSTYIIHVYNGIELIYSKNCIRLWNDYKMKNI